MDGPEILPLPLLSFTCSFHPCSSDLKYLSSSRSRALIFFLEVSWRRGWNTGQEMNHMCVFFFFFFINEGRRLIWVAKNFHVWDNRSFLQRMHLNITWASSSEGDWFFFFFWQLPSSSLPLGELASWRHRHLFLAHSGEQELEEGGDLFCTFGINLQNTGQQCFFLELLVHFKDEHKDSGSFVWHQTTDPGWFSWFS